MKNIDNMPIIITIAALLINIALGVSNNITFSALMVRCIIVAIMFGILGYLITETVKNALEYSRLSKQIPRKDGVTDTGKKPNENENKSVLDIKLLPLDDKEFMNAESDSDNEFVEMSPVNMSSYNQIKQD